MISFGTVQQTFESGWPDDGWFRYMCTPELTLPPDGQMSLPAA
jgi:hypothetical protein